MAKQNIFNKICINFLLLNLACRGDLVVTPRNVATIDGSPTVMECGTRDPNRTVIWKGVLQNSDTERVIFTGFRVTSDFNSTVHVDNQQRNHNLRFNVTTLSNAGTYICIESKSMIKSRAELIVLGEKDLKIFQILNWLSNTRQFQDTILWIWFR